MNEPVINIGDVEIHSILESRLWVTPSFYMPDVEDFDPLVRSVSEWGMSRSRMTAGLRPTCAAMWSRPIDKSESWTPELEPIAALNTRRDFDWSSSPFASVSPVPELPRGTSIG